MIIAVVQFDLPDDVTREKAIEMFRSVAPKFQNMPGLMRKNFLFSDESRKGGGVYLWKDRETAEKVHAEGGPWRENIRKLMGVDPQVVFYDSPVLVDNESDEVRIDA